MSIVFFVISVISLVIICINNPEAAFPTMIAGAEDAITLAVKLCAIYAVWLAVLRLAEDSGLSQKLNRLFRPLTKRLFKGEDEKTHEYITMNLSANLLGMGSAATPMGIKAIEKMYDGKSDKATHNMILLIVINCTSIQLFPGTIIGLRAAAGSAAASDIILPSLIATAASTVIGVVFCKIIASLKFKPKKAKK